MKISILTIPHKQQRYSTVGDWYTNKADGTVNIRVSELGSWRYELLVVVHELVEAFQCMYDGVTEESVDKFDKCFTNPTDEPGDDINAPYKSQHCLATGIERILAFSLGVHWADYEAKLDEVSQIEKVFYAVVKCSQCLKVLGTAHNVRRGAFVEHRQCAEHPSNPPIVEYEPEQKHA